MPSPSRVDTERSHQETRGDKRKEPESKRMRQRDIRENLRKLKEENHRNNFEDKEWERINWKTQTRTGEDGKRKNFENRKSKDNGMEMSW